MSVGNLFDLIYPFCLAFCLGTQEAVGGAVEDQTLVDHPPLLRDAGTLKIAMQTLRLQHRGGLRQCDDDKLRLILVAQSGKQPSDGYGRVASLWAICRS